MSYFANETMTKSIFLIFVTLIFVQISLAQKHVSKYAFEKFPADTVLKIIDDVAKELSAKHPGFYRYNSKEEFDHFIDSIKNTVKDSLTEMEAYLKLKPIISKIDCIHTGLSLPQEYKDYLNENPNLFPFQLFCLGSKSFVVKNHSNCESILAGDEIVSINGQRMERIIPKLFQLIPSDGYNLTRKYRALFYQFPGWYRSIDLTESFRVVARHHNIESTYQIAGKKFKDIAEEGFLVEPVRAKQLEFRIENNIGYLSIHSFARTEINRCNQNFRNFMVQTFSQLKELNIKNLVVDLRDNTGGSDPYAAYFTSYFFDKPFRYWDRIEVTQAVANEIKGAALKLYYRKPVLRDSIWLWQSARHSDEFDFYKEQKPASNNFKGKVYILINGFCMSSCADVIAILSYNKKATLIGQETGGCYQGNNSGMIPDTQVKPFDFTLSVPLQKYVNYVDRSVNIGRGTMPDYAVNWTIDDILKGDDLELDLANKLIVRLK